MKSFFFFSDYIKEKFFVICLIAFFEVVFTGVKVNNSASVSLFSVNGFLSDRLIILGDESDLTNKD